MASPRTNEAPKSVAGLKSLPYSGDYMENQFVDVDFESPIGQPNPEKAVTCVIVECGPAPANQLKVREIAERPQHLTKGPEWISEGTICDA